MSASDTEKGLRLLNSTLFHSGNEDEDQKLGSISKEITSEKRMHQEQGSRFAESPELGWRCGFSQVMPSFVHSPRVVSVLSVWGCESKTHVSHNLTFQEGIYSISLDETSQMVPILSPAWLCGSHNPVGLRVNQTELSPPRAHVEAGLVWHRL